MSQLSTGERRLRRLIEASAAIEQLPPFTYQGNTYTPSEFLEGLILHESRGDLRARRYERHHDVPGRADTKTDPDVLAKDDGPYEDDASYGLMQVLGTTFKRQLGADRPVRLNFEILYQPLFALGAGVLALKQSLHWVYRTHPHVDEAERVVRALCRYNGGGTGDNVDPTTGRFRVQVYVDKVAADCARVRADREASGWRPSL